MTQSANARHGVGICISRYVEAVVLKRDFWTTMCGLGSSLFGPDPDGDEIVPQKL